MSIRFHINPQIKQQICSPYSHLPGILLQINLWGNDSISTAVMPKANDVFVKVTQGISLHRHSMLVSYL